MNITKSLAGKLGLVLCSALLGYTTYAQPAVSVGVVVPVPSVEVVIHAESDFYEPLTPHGEWVVVGTYGRCWRPAHVEVGWRPYCNGSWQQTDAGWYWVSAEPWGWATYHYGRWDFTDQYGWYWVPQTQWAPAWVSWHEGGGYVGWAPLQPSVTISVDGFVGFNASHISPRAFVFVEHRRFLDPIRPTTVVANNTTIINKTTTITNTKIVNNTVINGGPTTAVIEKVSGRKIQAVPVQELRKKEEAVVAAKPRVPAAPGEIDPHGKKIAPVHEPAHVEKPAAVPHDPVRPAPKNKPVPPAPDSKPEVKPDVTPPPAIKKPIPPEPDKHLEKPAAPATPPDKKVPHPAEDKAPVKDKNGPNPADKDREKKPTD